VRLAVSISRGLLGLLRSCDRDLLLLGQGGRLGVGHALGIAVATLVINDATLEALERLRPIAGGAGLSMFSIYDAIK
jgi:hypothetical protein